MAMQTLNLSANLEELSALFLELLREVNFTVILHEDLEAGFRIIGADKKRMSQLTATLFSIIGGYLPRNRIAIELTALLDDGIITATLKCSPYLDILDIEAKTYTQRENETYLKLIKTFTDRIMEKFTMRAQESP
jgi:hypothetical protein